MNEFSLSEGRLPSGILAAAGSAFKYLILPLAIVSIINWLAQRIEFDVGALGIKQITNAVLVFGILIIIFSFFRGFYLRGSRPRALFGVVSIAFVIIWLWTITLGGKLILDLNQGGVIIDFSLLLYLFIFAAALRAIFFVVEMFSYRKEYLSRGR